jgi:tripartite-type tricarboxylate transporter receptor subunit TctC
LIGSATREGSIDAAIVFVAAKVSSPAARAHERRRRAGFSDQDGADRHPVPAQLPYDTVKSFAPISIIASAPVVVAANNDLPASTSADLIVLAKKQPGKLQYASSGVGTSLHMGGELFKQMAGVDTQLVFASIGSTITHLRSGKLKALGVGATQRNRLIPDVPTVAESGLPGYVVSNWFGIMAPAGTPPAIVARLHKEIAAIQDSPELQKQFANDGAEIVRQSSAEFGAHIVSELAKWGRVVKESGIKPE